MGTTNPNPTCVSSSTRTSADSGACIAAPISAAAPDRLVHVGPPGTYRRSRYQATPPLAPATTSDATRRTAEACSAPSSSVPLS